MYEILQSQKKEFLLKLNILFVETEYIVCFFRFVFNVKCYFGFAGCYGNMMIVWGMCTALLFVNRLVNSYFLRYLEGANFLVIVSVRRIEDSLSASKFTQLAEFPHLLLLYLLRTCAKTTFIEQKLQSLQFV